MGQAGRRAGASYKNAADGQLRDARGRFIKAGDDAAGSTEKAESRVKKASSGMSSAFAGIGAAAAAMGLSAVLSDSVAEAEDAKVSQEKLGQVMKSMGYAQHTAAVQDYANTLGQKIAIDNDDIAKTQAKIATFGELGKTAGQTGGYFNRVTEAAYNLSALGFGSAEDAAIMLSKAMNSPEQAAALSRTGALTKAEAAHAAELAKSGKTEQARAFIMAAVEKQASGAAEKNVTNSARMKVASAALKEQIGTALLPVVAKMADLFGKVAEWMGKHPGLVKILVPVIGALAAVLVIATVAIWAMNAALWANPITWVVAAVVALVAIFVVMYQKVGWFRTLVQTLAKVWMAGFKGILSAVKWVWEALKKGFSWVGQHWKTIGILLTGPIGWAVALIVKHFHGIVDFFKSIPKKLVSVGKAIVNALTYPFRTAVGLILDAWNALDFGVHVQLPSWAGGAGLNIDDIIPDVQKPGWLQGLATGGTVTSGGMFMVGERGPEQVFLPRGAAVTPNGGGTGITQHITINVDGVQDPGTVKATIEQALAVERRHTVAALRMARA